MVNPIHPLQTSAWEEFRKKWGNETARVDGNLLTIHPLPKTKYKIAIFEKGPEPTIKMLEILREFAQSQKIIMIRMEPNVLKSESLIKLMREGGAIPGKTIFTPTTFWIDLTKSEDDLLASFHPKTRYNIRLAQKRGVESLEDNSDNAFEKYLKLTRETGTRDKFFAHNEKYHRLMWETLKDKMAHLLTARYNSEVIAAWILFAHDGVLYYPYGASTHKYKNLMASNLMMWEAIKLGKTLGCHTFDLWGREPGKGFTRFKEGYNPKVIEFLGTWDLVINKPIYKLYRIAERVRWTTLRLQAQLGLTKYRF